MDIGDFDRPRKMDENARRIIGFIKKLMGITYAVAVFVAVAIVIYAGIALVCLLCSCTSTRYVPVESVRVEYRDVDTTAIYERMRALFESRYQREASSDSVIDRSKETVVLKENGDTTRHDKERIVYVASHRERELEHRVSEQDSVINALRLQLASVKADSIPVPYPVERRLNKWEQTKQDYGGYAIVILAVVICVAIVWIARRFRRR